MLKIIQIVALFQGFFVLSVLFINRQMFRKVTFWLLFGSLLSIVFFLIGDDENNLFLSGADWFIFDSSLFVTFLFLFFRYQKSGKEKFESKDLLFFIPNLLYFIFESVEIFVTGELVWIEIFELLIEFIFIAYLSYIIYFSSIEKIKNWLIYFATPIALVFILSSINEILGIIGLPQIEFMETKNYTTYSLLIVAFLFYYVSFGLMQSKDKTLPIKKSKHYKNSNLKSNLVGEYRKNLLRLMEDEKIYLDSNLSISDVANQLGIPRQYISEILNKHMDVSFQDFVNRYRVDEFVNKLRNDQNKHLTLFGIASEVGFNSKSSFNANFKKFKGLTPKQFKNSL
jgi:AraC-like DNA-binding protein